MPNTTSVPTFATGWQQATRYPDPAIVALDPRFEKYWLKLSCVERIATNIDCKRMSVDPVEMHVLKDEIASEGFVGSPCGFATRHATS